MQFSNENFQSTKLERLIDICDELIQEEKIIVFSQYVKSLEKINNKINEIMYFYTWRSG